MSEENLMLAARAAGFALAADEHADERPKVPPMQSPRDVLAPILTRDVPAGTAVPAPGMFQRALAATTLPAWVAGRA